MWLRNQTIDLLKEHLLSAQQQMKKFADRHHRDVSIATGDQVLLRLHPYYMKSLARRPNEKLSPRFYGSFEIEERIGPVAYRLKLPSTCRIHPVFHVSHLKLYRGMVVSGLPLPPNLSDEMELDVQPSVVLDSRVRSVGGKQVPEVLVQWDGLPSGEATWEPVFTIQIQFPSFNLGDKVG